MTDRADAQDPVVAKNDEDIHKPVQDTAVLARAAQTCIDLHVTDVTEDIPKSSLLEPQST